MAHLGDFGSALREARPKVEDTFTFMGEAFTVVETMPPMLMLTIAAASTGKIDEMEGLAAVYEAFSTCLTPTATPVDGEPPSDEFSRFWKLAVETSADFDVLVALALGLFSAQAGRPTEEPAGSSPGLSTVSPSSSSAPSLSQPPSAPEAQAPAEQEPVVLSTRERVARMRPVSELLTG